MNLTTTDEQQSVEAWRLKWFIELGFSVVIAERLAISPVDLHEAERLVKVLECPLDQAAQILL